MALGDYYRQAVGPLPKELVRTPIEINMPAKEARPQGALEYVHERIVNLRLELDEVRATLLSTNERVFGEAPVAADNRKEVDPSQAQFGQIHDQLNVLAEVVAEVRAQAARLAAL